MSEAQDFIDKIDRPIGDWLLIRKTARGEEVDGEFVDGGIVLPDTVWDNTNFVEIISVGGECKLYDVSMKGKTTWCPEAPGSLNNEGCPESFWWVREQDLIALLFDDGKITPIKDMVVVKVEKRTVDGLELSGYNKQYNPWGVVVAVGPSCVDLSVGEKVLVSSKSFTFLVGADHLVCLKESEIEAKDVVAAGRDTKTGERIR